MKASVFEKPLFALTTLALLMLGYGSPACAQATQSIYSPVIIVYDNLARYAGSDTARGWLQMHEDGSGLAQFASGGNLSYVGGAGGRYFLATQDNSQVTLRGWLQLRRLRRMARERRPFHAARTLST